MNYSNEFPSIFDELASYIQDSINDGLINDNNREDWHFHLFNEDYYIIGYYAAEKWMEGHKISAFTALDIIHEYEMDNFGETKTYPNAEVTVNMLVYIFGEELLNEASAEDIYELSEYLENR